MTRQELARAGRLPNLINELPDVFTPTELARAGWARVDGGGGKLSARWNGPDGWRLQHCGHPTALWPWALYSPAGDLVLTGAVGPYRDPTFGTAWRTLAQAVAFVDLARRAGSYAEIERRAA